MIPNPKCYVTKYQTANHWQLLLKPLLRRIIRGAFLLRFLCHSQFLPLVPLISTQFTRIREPFVLFFGFCNIPPTHKSKANPINGTKINQFPWIHPNHTFFIFYVGLFNNAWVSWGTFARMRHKPDYNYKEKGSKSSKDTLVSKY